MNILHSLCVRCGFWCFLSHLNLKEVLSWCNTPWLSKTLGKLVLLFYGPVWQGVEALPLTIPVARKCKSFKTYVFRFRAFCHEGDPGWAGYSTLTRLHGKLSSQLTGLPYLADRATRLGGSPHLSCERDQDKIRNYMDRRVTPPPCKEALSIYY